MGGTMSGRDTAIGGVLGIVGLSGGSEQPAERNKVAKKSPKNAGKDSVDISPRARRLANIENFLEDDEVEKEKLLEHKE